jgi:excisionase family DNA binding protein
MVQPLREKALTVPEAGRALGVSTATVWRMLRRGALPSYRKDGRRLIPVSGFNRRRPATSMTAPPYNEDHPMRRLIGAYRSGGQGPGAGDKHAILAKLK